MQNSFDCHIHTFIPFILTFASLATTLGTFGGDFVLFNFDFTVFHFLTYCVDVFPTFVARECLLRIQMRYCIRNEPRDVSSVSWLVSLDWIKSTEFTAFNMTRIFTYTTVSV